MRPPCSGSLSSSGVDPSAARSFGHGHFHKLQAGRCGRRMRWTTGATLTSRSIMVITRSVALTIASMPRVRKVSLFLGFVDAGDGAGATLR